MFCKNFLVIHNLCSLKTSLLPLNVPQPGRFLNRTPYSKKGDRLLCKFPVHSVKKSLFLVNLLEANQRTCISVSKVEFQSLTTCSSWSANKTTDLWICNQTSVQVYSHYISEQGNKVFGKCLKRFQQGLQESLLCKVGKTSYQCNTSGYVKETFTLNG